MTAIFSTMDRKRKCPSKACYCAVLTSWLTVAVIVFLITGFLYLKPLFKGLRLRLVPCMVENSFYTTQFICHCGSECKSMYPCVLIHVSFNVSDGEMWTVSLYKDEPQQQSVIGVDDDAQEWVSLIIVVLLIRIRKWYFPHNKNIHHQIVHTHTNSNSNSNTTLLTV